MLLSQVLQGVDKKTVAEVGERVTLPAKLQVNENYFNGFPGYGIISEEKVIVPAISMT